jgi:Ca2+-binding RTX toxin-like protein
MRLYTDRGRRGLIVPALAAALAMPLLSATPAAACTTGTVSRSGGVVTFEARPGVNNQVTFYVATAPLLRVSDPAGITAGPGCTQTSPRTATCGEIAGITAIHADGGDGDDRLAAGADLDIPVDFNGGPGQDVLVGGTADDHLADPDGWLARPDRATFRGLAGNDVIISRNGGYDRVECEGGTNDTVTADVVALDQVTNTCETINRG